MSGRTYTADTTNKYRFGGSNGQEKDDEVFAGAFSAEYWEYDSRLGRRWNVDPKPCPLESPYDVFRNNPICVIDIKGDSGEYYDTRGNLLFVSHDALPNAVIIIPDQNLKHFMRAKNQLLADAKASGNKKLLDDRGKNAYLRWFGKTYLVNQYWSYFDKTKEIYTGTDILPKDGKGPLFKERKVNLYERFNTIRIGTNEDREGTPDRTALVSKHHLHTHPNEGRKVLNVNDPFKQIVPLLPGFEGAESDLNSSWHTSGSAYYDVVVTSKTIILYNSQEHFPIMLHRNQMFKR